MSAIDNTLGLSQDIFAEDSEWVTGKIKLSSSIEQEVLATGKLIKKWVKVNRNYFEYTVEKPAPFNWYIGSVKYQIKSILLTLISMQKLLKKQFLF